MRATLQRVSHAEVRVAGQVVGRIAEGYVALIGVEKGDAVADVDWICRKIVNLRLWPDTDGKMNLPLGARAVLAVSQFTLFADCRRGNRPGFEHAAGPTEAKPTFD
ncbi:MAG: D-aminoacyl-tRNA deacylase, partial [Terriglobales bacterium]